MAEEKTESTKDKLDKLLGIGDGQSVDDWLSDISDDASEVKQKMSEVSDNVKESIAKIDSKLEEAKSGAIGPQLLVDLNSSMKEVEDLIDTSKQMFKHIYESIITTDLIDSELVGAAGKLLEAIHINIAEFLNMYKDRQKFIDKIKLLTFQQEQKKELMRLKHEQELEKIKLKNEADSPNAANGEWKFDVDKIVEFLDDTDKKSDEDEIEPPKLEESLSAAQ